MQRKEFSELEEREFVLLKEDGTKIGLKLIEVSEIREMDTHKEFSLVFLAPVNSEIDARTYALKNETLGEIALSLSPFWSDENGLKLEAAFSITN